MYRLIKAALRAAPWSGPARRWRVADQAQLLPGQQLPTALALHESVNAWHKWTRPFIGAILGPMSTTVRCKHHSNPAAFVLVRVRPTYSIIEAACLECVHAEVNWLEDTDCTVETLSVALMPRCGNCQTPLVTQMATVEAGRPRKWCSDACRKQARRTAGRLGRLAG